MQWLVDIFRQLGYPEPERAADEMIASGASQHEILEAWKRICKPRPMIFSIEELVESARQ